MQSILETSMMEIMNVVPMMHPAQWGPRQKVPTGLTSSVFEAFQRAIGSVADNVGGHPAGGWKWNPDIHGPLPM